MPAAALDLSKAKRLYLIERGLGVLIQHFLKFRIGPLLGFQQILAAFLRYFIENLERAFQILNLLVERLHVLFR